MYALHDIVHGHSTNYTYIVSYSNVIQMYIMIVLHVHVHFFTCTRCIRNYVRIRSIYNVIIKQDYFVHVTVLKTGWENELNIYLYARSSLLSHNRYMYPDTMYITLHCIV